MNRNRRRVLALGALLGAGLLGGCGQKGPLYLPQEREEKERAAREPAPRRHSRRA